MSLLGKQFVTNRELSFKELIVPKGTMFEVIESNIDWGGNKNCYKVHFSCRHPHREDIQTMTYDEIKEIKL